MIIYDATRYLNKPETLPGTRPMHFLGHTNLWKEGSDINGLPDNYGNLFESEGGDIPDGDAVYIDIEHWEQEHGFKTATEMYEQTARDWLKWYPKRRTGFYNEAPIGDYWPTQSPIKPVEEWHEWRSRCRAREDLAKITTIVHPACYNFYDNDERWLVYAARTIEEGRRYGVAQFPFICPQWHPGGSQTTNAYVPIERFRMQWDVIKHLCGGAVIWGGWRNEDGERMEWDDHIAEIFSWFEEYDRSGVT